MTLLAQVGPYLRREGLDDGGYLHWPFLCDFLPDHLSLVPRGPVFLDGRVDYLYTSPMALTC